jgi:hypothetical protein
MWKYVLLWCPMVLIAVANGALRELGLRRLAGELTAHQISTVLLLVLFSLYTWLVLGAWPPASARQALAVGLLWLVLTLAFEFLFGHYGAKKPWSELLHDYDLRAGRLWALVPLWIAVAPSLLDRLRQKSG